MCMIVVISECKMSSPSHAHYLLHFTPDQTPLIYPMKSCCRGHSLLFDLKPQATSLVDQELRPARRGPDLPAMILAPVPGLMSRDCLHASVEAFPKQEMNTNIPLGERNEGDFSKVFSVLDFFFPRRASDSSPCIASTYLGPLISSAMS